jgi:hypothetical protein
MTSTLKISILSFIFAVFVSCDCLQHVQGTVIDAETQQPISEVAVKKDINVIILTDSIGNFEFTTMTGGLFGCPKISLSFEKEDYSKTTKEYKSCCIDNNVVVLEKQAK